MSQPLRSPHSSPHGFTLVELLVVISIVAMLMALLMPALSKARSTANRISCATTQRQLGIALINYTLDSKDRLPVPSDYNVNHNIYLYRGNTNAAARKHAQGAMGLGLLWHGQYATNPEIFYCTEFRTTDTMSPYIGRQAAVTRFRANYGKTSANANHDLNTTYVLSRSANVHPGGTPSGIAQFQDTDGLVTDARPKPRYDASPANTSWIGGLLSNNLNPPTNDAGTVVYRDQFYPIVVCMQLRGSNRISHDGKFTNRLAGDGSVRPLQYDFAALVSGNFHNNWITMTYINAP